MPGNTPADQGLPGAVLLGDIGTTLTHVALVDRVDGAYRLLACAEEPTTLAGAEEDVTIGLGRAVQRLEEATERRLWRGGAPLLPESDGDGADLLVATCSAAPPLRTVVVGLTDDLSVESARRACASSNTRLERCIALGMRFRNWDDETLTMLYREPPQVIVLVGGADGGPVQPLEHAGGVLATLYERTPLERRPTVVFAGNLEARRPLASLLSPLMGFRVVDNVRPNVRVESLGELERELARLYEEVALPRVPGFARLSTWAATPVRSTFEATATTARFLARRLAAGQGVLAVDVGSLTTHVVAARGRVYQWVTVADTGTGYGLEGVLDAGGAAGVTAWMPREVPEEDALALLHNARLRPHGVPTSRDELLLLHGALRQALGAAVERLRQEHWSPAEADAETDAAPGAAPVAPAQTPPFDLLAVRGGLLAHTPLDGLVALSLLDAVQPVGLSRVVVDWASVWPALSALAEVAPLAAFQVLDRDAFRDLATVIAPTGVGQGEEPALRVMLLREGQEPMRVIVPSGTIVRLPLERGEEATLEVRPSRHCDIGLGRPGLGGRTVVRGGGLGILIDTRGRPLDLPQDPRQRQERIAGWLRHLEQTAGAPPRPLAPQLASAAHDADPAA